MKTTKRSWLIRIAFILVLVLIAVVMLRIGAGAVYPVLPPAVRHHL